MKKIALLLVLSSLNLAVLAAPLTFDFKDPKSVNNVVFKTDAPLESINGTATGVSGTVTFDPADPAARVIADNVRNRSTATSATARPTRRNDDTLGT